MANSFPWHLLQAKLFSVAALSGMLSLIGCSHRPPVEGRGGEAMATAVPSMSAQDSFFDGKLLVEANLGRGFSGRGMGAGPGGGHGGRGGGRRGGGGMSMGGGMGGMGMGGGHGGDPMNEMGGGPRDRGESGPVMHESNQPPVALRLRLTNKSKETVEVTFVLCKSELGDFAVRPEKLALAPEQTAEPDPMTSRLGLPSDELILRVSLRTGGKTEQKDLTLRKNALNEPADASKP